MYYILHVICSMLHSILCVLHMDRLCIIASIVVCVYTYIEMLFHIFRMVLCIGCSITNIHIYPILVCKRWVMCIYIHMEYCIYCRLHIIH